MSKPICQHCVAEVQLAEWFKLSAGTVLQGWSCLSSVKTFLMALCCRGAAVKAVSKPICRHCVAGVQLYKQCRNLPASTVLQGCSCLSGVETFLLGTVLQRCSCIKGCQNISAGTVLQGCSCLSILTYLPALCCRGSAF